MRVLRPDITRPLRPRIACILIALILTALVVWQLSSNRAEAAAGDLDTSFGIAGNADTGVFGTAKAVALLPDGKLILAGDPGPNNSNPDFIVARLNADGSIDTGFGTSGKVVTNIKGLDLANAVVIQGDGKIVVGGEAEASNSSFSDFALLRYHPNGSVDPTFGNGQFVRTDFSGSSDTLRSMVIQTDQKIVGVGTTLHPDMGSLLALVRYNSDGSLDSTFGVGGRVTTSFPNFLPKVNKVVIQPDGKILVVGGVAPSASSSFDFVVLRYNSDGSLDSGFGVGGKVFTDFFGRDDEATSIAIQTNGKIVVAGRALATDLMRFGVARYNADGTPDQTFGTGGSTTTAFGASVWAGVVLIQPDDKLVVVGSLSTSLSTFENGTGAALVRYNTDGSLDTTFGTNGRVIGAVTGSHVVQTVYSGVMQPNGRIVVVGRSENNFGAARFLNDITVTPTPGPTAPPPTPIPAGSLDTSFGVNGTLQLDVAGGGVESCATAVVSEPSGKVLVAGEVGGQLVVQDGVISRNVTDAMDFALVRLELNGSFDTSFGNSGRVTTDISAGDAAFAIARQPDGKIVLTGVTNVSGTTQSDVALVRYNSDGSLDTSFGTGGKVRTDFGGSDRAYGVALQTDQKIVVAGPIGGSFAVVRYNPNGSLDTLFGSGGRVSISSGTAYAVSIQPDQKIVVAGTSSCDFAAARLNSDGSFDLSFGSGGKVLTDLGFNFCDEAHSIVIQSDGKIVLAGDLTAKQFGVVRYDSAGNLDATFGNGGKVLTVFSNREAIANGVVILANGNLIAVGGAGPIFEPPNQPPSTFALASYNQNGSLNTSFGNSGIVTTVMSNSSNRQASASAMGAALQPDGKLVVVGAAFTTKTVFGIARYYTSLGGPTLLREGSTEKAIALDSVIHTAGPFPLLSVYYLNQDRTRIMLFAVYTDLLVGEDASAVTAQAEDSQHIIYPLTVEIVGKVPGFGWLTQVNVKLPEALANPGDLSVSISLRGLTSNKVLISIRPSQ